MSCCLNVAWSIITTFEASLNAREWDEADRLCAGDGKLYATEPLTFGFWRMYRLITR